LGGAKYSEEQYLVWDIAYRSTKQQDMLEIWAAAIASCPPALATPMRKAQSARQLRANLQLLIVT